MATQTASDTVHVTVTAAATRTQTAADTVHVTVGAAAAAILYRWTGTQGVPVQLGYWDGSTAQLLTTGRAQALTRSGTQLRVGPAGPQYRATGWNSYVLRSAGGTPTQTMTDAQRASFFAGLAPGSLVRVWAFPPAAGTYTDAAVLTEQDKIVASAKAAGHRLIMCLADWAGNANDGTGVKSAAWFTSQAWAGRYATWLDTIVGRYAAEPTVAVWDLMNEPRLPANSSDLRGFVDAMGSRVKAADGDALVMCGILTPAISCGSTAAYQTVMASSAIDLVTYHDYAETSTGNDATFTAVLGVAQALGKPMVIDEVGVWASSDPATHTATSPGGYAPVTYAQQAATISAKLTAYGSHPEVAGALVWSEMEAGIADPGYEPPPGAPARATVHDFTWPASGAGYGASYGTTYGS